MAAREHDRHHRARRGVRRRRGRDHRGAVLGGVRGADRRCRARRGDGRRLVRCAAARSSRAARPYSFQGLGERGLELSRIARQETGLPIVTEAMDEEGARCSSPSMPTAFRSARATCRTIRCSRPSARIGKPVLLKRGMAATINDLLLSAEYMLAERERGCDPLRARRAHLRPDDAQHVRSHGDSDRAAAVAPADRRPIRVTERGFATRCIPMARAAVAAGANGMIVEVHPTSRARAVGRRAVAVPRAVRAARW